MRLMIDIDEDVRIAISRMGLLRISDEMQKKVDKAIQHGTPIPDNATVYDIEQIQAEIAEYKDDKIIHAERNEMIDIVLEILDKYR